MPPRIPDGSSLRKISGHLRDISDIVGGLAELAQQGSPEGDHVEPLEQIARSFEEIAEELKGIGTAGDHSGQYRQIEASLGRIANAVKSLGSGNRETR